MSNFPSSVICETSTVQDGNMDFRFGAKTDVIANRTNYLQHYGIAYQEHVAMSCSHGEIISSVDGSSFTGPRSQEEQITSEVLVTQKKHLALFLLTADCLPVSFYDPVTQTIALAHLSRATISKKLAQKTVSFLRSELKVDPSNLHIYVGPYIHKESYAFALPLSEVDPVLVHFIEEKDGQAHIDLLSACIAQLTNAGVKKERIASAEEDTATDPNYFSYYKLKKNGGTQEARMGTILMMR